MMMMIPILLKISPHPLQVYKNFVLANEYQSSKLCEALYTKCEDDMDRLQALRLPSMAKFNAGFVYCNQSFEQQCVGPSKQNYEQRLTKVTICKHTPKEQGWENFFTFERVFVCR